MTVSNEASYLSKFGAALRRMKVAGAEEIVADVRGHIAESVASERSLEQTLTALGAPDALARAYAVELAMSQYPTDRQSISSIAKLTLLLIGASTVTLIVVPTLLLFAFTFLVTGFFSFIFAIIELLIVDLPFVQNDNISPIEALGVSAPVFAAGCLFAWLLWRYLKYVAATLRKALPR